MQDFKNYFNPSTALMWPKECGFGYYDSFQFVDDTIGVNQSNVNATYIIRFRGLMEDLYYSYTPENYVNNLYCAPNKTLSNPTYQWFSFNLASTLTDVSNNVISIPVKDVFDSNPDATATYGGLFMSRSFNGKNMQWSWGKTTSDSVAVTGSAGSMIMNVSLDALNSLQNYQFVEYTDSDATVSYGYICKYNTNYQVSDTIVIYKYIDGAINMTTPTTDDCVAMTSASGTVSAYLFSDWVNCYFYSQLSSSVWESDTIGRTIGFRLKSITSVKNTFSYSVYTYYGICNYPYDFKKFILYDSTGNNILFQSENIYDQNLFYILDGINPDVSNYMAEVRCWIMDGEITSGKVLFTTNIAFDYASTYSVSSIYNNCDDYITVKFDDYSTAVNACSSLKLYMKESDALLYDVVWDYVADNTSASSVVTLYNVANGKTYDVRLYGIDKTGKQFYQNLGSVTVKFDGYFLDDTVNKTTYHFISSLNGGNQTVTNNMTEIKQNLQYNSNLIGMTKFKSGEFEGQLVSNTDIDNNFVVNNFKEFVSSNRLTYFKTPNGECYNSFITDTTCSMLSRYSNSSPINVSFNWHQIADK